ncbi:MAG: hypothetical protein ISS15_15870 [Alphaproteobacteria bacterium]|nr:hypothetical protein [Alphaproteobacteria bacterium]MBL6938038.1 hypothetical protein [Alphaproteobacteria bacterium]MBL7099137.1 hypothetical protein [Alphaproteobacteria bacterium]
MSDPIVPAPISPAPPPPAPARSNADQRWRFIRDVGVFELKLALNNLHNFFQIPLTLAVAAFDLVVRSKNGEGERFYKLVEMGRTIDDSIDIYSIVAHRERKLNDDYTVDAVLGKLEDVVIKEYEKGGTAASIKAAVDRAIDGMQTRTGEHASRMADVVKNAADKIHDSMSKMEGGQPAPPPPPGQP